MNIAPDVERSLRAWLADGPEQLPDVYLDAALEEISTTPQRRATWWPLRRLAPMNTSIRLALGVAVVAVAALVGVSTLNRDSGRAPAPSPAESASPTPSGSVAAELRLPRAAGPPISLEPGTYLTPEGFEPVMSVTVPEGWYGGAGTSGLGLGQGLDELNERFSDVELYVDVIPTSYAEAVAGFQELVGLSAQQNEPAAETFDGYEATTFRARALGENVLLDPIAPGLDIGPAAAQQTFVDVDGITLLIRTAVYDDAAEPVLEQVLASLDLAN
jgi:hypothetical protein